jgi:microcystin-dependent protein
MAEPYIGEIRMFGGVFAPAGWLPCDGTTYSISQLWALFDLIGAAYGGDGQNTFAVPDLRGRLPVHQGAGWAIGTAVGTETVTLTADQLGGHTHQVNASADQATSTFGGSNVAASLPTAGSATAYGLRVPPGALDPSEVSGTGGSQPHANVPPFLCVTFIIAYTGIYPSQG